MPEKEIKGAEQEDYFITREFPEGQVNMVRLEIYTPGKILSNRFYDKIYLALWEEFIENGE